MLKRNFLSLYISLCANIHPYVAFHLQGLVYNNVGSTGRSPPVCLSHQTLHASAGFCAVLTFSQSFSLVFPHVKWSGEPIYWHTVETKQFSYLTQPSIRDWEVLVTLCERKRRCWTDISRPMTGAAVTPVGSFCFHSCVHMAPTHQSWAAGPQQAHWPKHVLSACPSPAPKTSRLRPEDPVSNGTQILVREYLGLAKGITAARKEAICSPCTRTGERQQPMAAS